MKLTNPFGREKWALNADGMNNTACAEDLRAILDPRQYDVKDNGDGSVTVTSGNRSHRVMQHAPLTEALVKILWETTLKPGV